MVGERLLGCLLGLVFLIWVIPAVGPWLIPSSWFFTVESVTVEDSTHGQPPQITPIRTIRRDFRGEWTVYVRKLLDDGTAFPYCTARSPAPITYFVSAGPILGQDMDWWMEIPPNAPCPWEPGMFIVLTEWRILLPFGITLQEHNVSNPFEIRPLPKGAVVAPG